MTICVYSSAIIVIMTEHFRISDFMDESRPREKLLRFGAESLSDAELLAILLGSGTKDRNVLELANDILREQGGLAGLRKISKESLTRIKGIGPAKSTVILSTIELGRRFSRAIREDKDRQRINCAEDLYQYVHYQLEHLDHEELLVICMDIRHYVIGEVVQYKGTINTSSIRAAEIFRKPLLMNAACFAMAHNHPSGDATPSPADIVVTRNIFETGQKLDLPLVDHIVVGAGTYTSIRNIINTMD